MFQRTLLIVSILALTPAASLAKTTQDRVEKFLAKYAVAEDDLFSGKFKPRGACACTATGQGDAFPGFLVLQNNGKINCAAGLIYDAQGEIASYAPCGDFEVLGR